MIYSIAITKVFNFNIFDYKKQEIQKQIPKTLGEALKKYRQINNLKQKDIAKLLNVETPTYTRWENDNPIPLEMYIKVNNILHIYCDNITLTSRKFVRKKLTRDT